MDFQSSDWKAELISSYLEYNLFVLMWLQSSHWYVFFFQFYLNFITITQNYRESLLLSPISHVVSESSHDHLVTQSLISAEIITHKRSNSLVSRIFQMRIAYIKVEHSFYSDSISYNHIPNRKHLYHFLTFPPILTVFQSDKLMIL